MLKKEINNIDKLYKNIWLYKSLFYHNVKFTTKKEVDEQTKYIINALNIKNRNKRIEYVYDRACDLLDNQNKNINICGFKNRKCWVQQKLNNGNKCGCCRLCLYAKETGCPSKNIACKLFNCSEVTNRYKVLTYKDLKILKVLGLYQRIIIKHDYFSLREDVLKDLYSYSLTYSTIRIVYRIIKNLILLKKQGNWNHKLVER